VVKERPKLFLESRGQTAARWTLEVDWMNYAAEAAFQKALSLEQLLNLRHFAEAVRCLQISEINHGLSRM
jgi:hypothetical protein